MPGPPFSASPGIPHLCGGRGGRPECGYSGLLGRSAPHRARRGAGVRTASHTAVSRGSRPSASRGALVSKTSVWARSCAGCSARLTRRRGARPGRTRGGRTPRSASAGVRCAVRSGSAVAAGLSGRGTAWSRVPFPEVGRAGRPVRGQRQTGFHGGAEAGEGFTGRPGQRGAAAVAARGPAPGSGSTWGPGGGPAARRPRAGPVRRTELLIGGPFGAGARETPQPRAVRRPALNHRRRMSEACRAAFAIL